MTVLLQINKYMLQCKSQALEGNAANLLLAKYLLSRSFYGQRDPLRHGIQSLLAASTFPDSKQGHRGSNVAK